MGLAVRGVEAPKAIAIASVAVFIFMMCSPLGGFSQGTKKI
jgi:low affinity Fe/Cu permease